MTKYHVTAMCTISVTTDVEAESEEEALEIAIDRGMQDLCYQCSGGQWSSLDASREWVTSGEIDGKPFNLMIEVEEE